VPAAVSPAAVSPAALGRLRRRRARAAGSGAPARWRSTRPGRRPPAATPARRDAARVRRRRAHPAGARRSASRPRGRLLAADLLALVARAERYGVRPRRAARWRARLRAGADAPAVLREAERRLRAWVERRRAEPYAGAV
jgi:hypothetical protein